MCFGGITRGQVPMAVIGDICHSMFDSGVIGPSVPRYKIVRHNPGMLQMKAAAD